MQSLVLVPAESPASVHVRRNGRHGWVVELDCRGVLSHDLEAVVAARLGPAGTGHLRRSTCTATPGCT